MFIRFFLPGIPLSPKYRWPGLHPFQLLLVWSTWQYIWSGYWYKCSLHGGANSYTILWKSYIILQSPHLNHWSETMFTVVAYRRGGEIKFVDCQADRITYEFLKSGNADITGITFYLILFIWIGSGISTISGTCSMLTKLESSPKPLLSEMLSNFSSLW